MKNTISKIIFILFVLFLVGCTSNPQASHDANDQSGVCDLSGKCGAITENANKDEVIPDSDSVDDSS